MTFSLPALVPRRAFSGPRPTWECRFASSEIAAEKSLYEQSPRQYGLNPSSSSGSDVLEFCSEGGDGVPAGSSACRSRIPANAAALHALWGILAELLVPSATAAREEGHLDVVGRHRVTRRELMALEAHSAIRAGERTVRATPLARQGEPSKRRPVRAMHNTIPGSRHSRQTSWTTSRLPDMLFSAAESVGRWCA